MPPVLEPLVQLDVESVDAGRDKVTRTLVSRESIETGHLHRLLAYALASEEDLSAEASFYSRVRAAALGRHMGRILLAWGADEPRSAQAVVEPSGGCACPSRPAATQAVPWLPFRVSDAAFAEPPRCGRSVLRYRVSSRSSTRRPQSAAAYAHVSPPALWDNPAEA